MMIDQTYEKWLETKITVTENAGFHIELDDLHPNGLKPFNKIAVQWALKKGRCLLAAAFGLHKTRMQIEIARQLVGRAGGRFLVVAPLAVKHQFQAEDGPAMGTEWQYVRTDAEVEAASSPYLITNYERIREGDIDPRRHNLCGVSLDEGSVLRSLGSKTYDVFERAFANVPYRFVATATPSPNEYRELIYYARFLGIMDTGQALTRFFQRDSTKAGQLTLYPHHEKEFWLWVASWALFIYKPSDLGGDDTGYDLPGLNVHWHVVDVDHSRAWEQYDSRGQGRLFLDAANGLREAAAEKRHTLQERLTCAKDIMLQHPDRHWLIWHHLEDERRQIEKEIEGAVTVYGSQALEERESRIIAFSHGEFPILATKPEIAGSGCNFQRYCYSNIFLGVDYKFQDFIQSIHRTHRFGQPHEVDVHIVYAESEQEIVNVLRRKWEQHNRLSEKMQRIIKKYGLSSEALKGDLKRDIGLERLVQMGDLFTAVNNDCVREMPHIATDSIGLVHTSIPFGNHYEYTTQIEDFGHNPTNAEFWGQMDFLIPELLRVLKPGRLAAIHVKDRILYGYQTSHGFMEVAPFSDECVMAFRRHGFIYCGRRTITTDVVAENNQTYRLGYTEMTKDASKMGAGSPEYLLLFRKPPTSTDNSRADEPVVKDKDDYSLARWQIDADAPWASSGDRLLTPAEYAEMYDLSQARAIWQAERKNNVYDYDRHVAIVEAMEAAGKLPKTYGLLPAATTRDETDWVWSDINRMRVLNSEQSRKRLESHICPLPLDIVRRTIRLYSNPGDIVLDPFGGLMSVPYAAIQMGRKGYGIELNSEYFRHGLGYLRGAETAAKMPTLFDLAKYSTEALSESEK